MVGGARRKMGNGGEWKVFGNVGVYVFWAAVLFTVLHPALFISVSQPLIMLVSVPEMPTISQGHWIAQLQVVPLPVYFYVSFQQQLNFCLFHDSPFLSSKPYSFSLT